MTAAPAPRLETSLAADMLDHVGRHADKRFDWDAFPGNRGFAELARAQMRYIGGGGSPKVSDPKTLKPEHFTLSMVYKPVGNYAACHSHEVVEHFLILSGYLTVGWAWGDEVIETQLAPGDMVLNAKDRPHGFRNDGVEPVLMSITVGSGKPKPPVYVCHPKTDDPAKARVFGAAPGKTTALDPTSSDPRHQEFARHILRNYAQPPRWDQAGLARRSYVGGTGAPADRYSMEMVDLPKGLAVKPYTRSVEDAILVLDGTVTVGWVRNGETVEQRLNPRDLILTPAGTAHYFRNDDSGNARFMLLAGGDDLDKFTFDRA